MSVGGQYLRSLWVEATLEWWKAETNTATEKKSLEVIN
jgi:hypothetical protein